MAQTKEQTTFIAANGHTAAREFAKEVCSNAYYMGLPKWIKNSTLRLIVLYFRAFIYAFIIPKYETYLAHGSPGLLCCVIKRKLRREKCKIIIRANDSMFSDYDVKGIKKKFLSMLYKHVDGAIAISNMIKNDIKDKLPNIPVEVVYCQILDNEYFDIKPSFEKKDIMCLGTAPRDRKGTDIQLSVYESFCPKKFMYIMGNTKPIIKQCKEHNVHGNYDGYHVDSYWGRLFFTGKDDPKKYMKTCLFLLHPARFDAGGNAVLEAMAAGLIPVVSYKTGNSEIVKNVDETLVINTFNNDDYFNKLKQLYNLPFWELQTLSNKCKIEAFKYSKKRMAGKFREAFNNVSK